MENLGGSLRLRALTLGLAIALVVSSCGDNADESSAIRVGWQSPWATQGQVVQTLVNTNVLQLVDLEVDLAGFSSGAPLNEAALNQRVDVLFTADQPAATLLANGGEFTIVARLMYNRVGIYVPPESPIRNLIDLEGATVGVPFGAAAQRDALQAVKGVGLEPGSDVSFVNLDILEHSSIVQAGSDSSWPGFDALAGFDPTPAILETDGSARMLHVGTVVSVVMVSNDLLERRPDEVERLLAAYQLAWLFYAQNPEQAGEWFRESSDLEFSDAVLDLAASVEPNLGATDLAALKLKFSDDDLGVLQDASDFLLAQDLIEREVIVLDHIDLDPLTSSEELAREVGIDAVRSTGG